MNILFIYPHVKRYNSRTVREEPCGGTEKAVTFLGEALQQLGHAVEWITTPDGLKQPLHFEPDVVVTQEAALFDEFPKAKKAWWTHHFSDQPIIQRSVPYARAFADVTVTLSRCHADDFRQRLRLDSVTIGHGVWHSELAKGVQRDPYRLIYASTPFRGLEKVPALFREIKAREPRATLAVASSMATYGTPLADAEYKPIFDELATIDGVELLGSLNQEALYREYAKSGIFFYPCIWPETYCLALDEAMAHGCVPVTTGLAALGERAPATADEEMAAETLACFDMAAHLKEIGRYRDLRQRIYKHLNDSRPDLKKEPKNYIPVNWTVIAKEWEGRVL